MIDQEDWGLGQKTWCFSPTCKQPRDQTKERPRENICIWLDGESESLKLLLPLPFSIYTTIVKCQYTSTSAFSKPMWFTSFCHITYSMYWLIKISNIHTGFGENKIKRSLKLRQTDHKNCQERKRTFNKIDVLEDCKKRKNNIGKEWLDAWGKIIIERFFKECICQKGTFHFH